MPVYEYRCVECGEVEEHLLPIGSPAPAPCRACGGELRKKFSRIAVRYEGWGFAATDRLVSDTRGRDFKALRAKAEQIAEE